MRARPPIRWAGPRDFRHDRARHTPARERDSKVEILPHALDSAQLLAAAAEVTSRRLDHFPSLIIDRCLENATETLAETTRSGLASGRRAVAEVITMPRRLAGPRPVQVLSPVARTAYTAMVEALGEALPEPTRGAGRWSEHSRFGLEGPHDYVVDVDIAACYEYISHDLLIEELVLRSMDVPQCAALGALLGEIAPTKRGLPQMLRASDLLADAYLSVLDRRLERDGLNLHRYADDIRLLASDWGHANRLVEDCAEYCRDLGLILAGHKTTIYKKATLIELAREDAVFFDGYFQAAIDDLTRIIYVLGSNYANTDEEIEEVIEPDELEAAEEAARTILYEWHALVRAEKPVPNAMRRFLPVALSMLGKSEHRLPESLLQDMVFHEPQRLEQVCQYVVRRAANKAFARERHWGSLRGLVTMGRQGPWAKLWLLHTMERLPGRSSQAVDDVREWAVQQLTDRHEVVRAQAAWALALDEALPPRSLGPLYARSSEMSQAALAAAATIQPRVPPSVLRAIQEDAPLNREAAQWAVS